MSEESSLLKEIEEDIQSGAPKLVYADWLEERGRYNEAFAWRYLVWEGKWPCVNTCPLTDDWFSYNESNPNDKDRIGVKEEEYRCLPGVTISGELDFYKKFNDIYTAFVTASKAIALAIEHDMFYGPKELDWTKLQCQG